MNTQDELTKLCQELTAELEQCRLERDGANATLKAIAECVGSDDPMAVRGVAEMLDCVKAERDEVEAKCAEMLKILQEHHGWHLEGPKVFFSEDGRPCPIETDLCEAYVESEMCDRTCHALSTDCGKGFVRVGELERTVEVLRFYGHCGHGGDCQHDRSHCEADSELTRLSKLIKDATT